MKMVDLALRIKSYKKFPISFFGKHYSVFSFSASSPRFTDQSLEAFDKKKFIIESVHLNQKKSKQF